MLVQLKTEVGKLHGLLAAPEPGLVSWNVMVGRQWKIIAELWEGEGREIVITSPTERSQSPSPMERATEAAQQASNSRLKQENNKVWFELFKVALGGLTTALKLDGLYDENRVVSEAVDIANAAQTAVLRQLRG